MFHRRITTCGFGTAWGEQMITEFSFWVIYPFKTQVKTHHTQHILHLLVGCFYLSDKSNPILCFISNFICFPHSTYISSLPISLPFSWPPSHALSLRSSLSSLTRGCRYHFNFWCQHQITYFISCLAKHPIATCRSGRAQLVLPCLFRRLASPSSWQL